MRYCGKWMRDEAERRIGKLYTKIEITPEVITERPDLLPYKGRKLTVIAWRAHGTKPQPGVCQYCRTAGFYVYALDQTGQKGVCRTARTAAIGLASRWASQTTRTQPGRALLPVNGAHSVV